MTWPRIVDSRYIDSMKTVICWLGVACGILGGASIVMAQDEPGTFRTSTTEVKSTVKTASVSETKANANDLDIYHRATMNLAVG